MKPHQNVGEVSSFDNDRSKTLRGLCVLSYSGTTRRGQAGPQGHRCAQAGGRGIPGKPGVWFEFSSGEGNEKIYGLAAPLWVYK